MTMFDLSGKTAIVTGGERIPAGRWGTPEDLQGPVVFLASAASDYMNGHVLNVDRGWMGI